MNLVSDRWIPVQYSSLDNQKVGLKKLFEDSRNIADFVVSPIERIALIRLLICITQAALNGPNTAEELHLCKENITQKALEYLDKRKDCFELFGDKPFLQIRALESNNRTVIDKLDFELSSGNNHNFFDHHAVPEGRIWTHDSIALKLLVFQCFSPGGLIGIASWNNIPTGSSKSSYDSPCVEGSMLHTIIRKKNLLDTVHANILTKDCIHSLKMMEWGSPVWEKTLANPNDKNIKIISRSYLGRLVPLSRAILLDENCQTMILSNGIIYPHLPESRDPMGTVKIFKDRRAYLRTDPQKHPWRELESIFQLSYDNVGGVQTPLALQNLALLSNDEHIDIWTGGLATNKAKIIDSAEWVFSIPCSVLGSTSLKKYQEQVNRANKAADMLGSAIKIYWKELKAEQYLSSKTAFAKLYFWSVLDKSYTLIIKSIETNDPKYTKEWRDLILETARSSYRRYCPSKTPRQIQAFAKGLKLIRTISTKGV